MNPNISSCRGISPTSGMSPFSEVSNDTQGNGYRTFQLEAKKLNKDLCHLFHLPMLPEEMPVLTSLEFLSFHPSNPTINDRFQTSIVKCGDLPIFWFAVPKEYTPMIQRISRIFKLHAVAEPREMVSGGRNAPKLIINIPKCENILIFQTESQQFASSNANSKTFDHIKAECKMIKELGDSLERLGVD